MNVSITDQVLDSNACDLNADRHLRPRRPFKTIEKQFQFSSRTMGKVIRRTTPDRGPDRCLGTVALRYHAVRQRMQSNLVVDRVDLFRRQRPPSPARVAGHAVLRNSFVARRRPSLRVRQ